MGRLDRNILNRPKGAPMAFAVRMAGRGLAFVLAMFLTRILGADQYGNACMQSLGPLS